MFAFLVVILLCYLLYDGVTRLIQHEGPFELVHWAMLVLCILYVPVIIFSALRAFKNYKESKESRAEKEVKQRDELAARKRRFYLDDDDESIYVETEDIDQTDDDGDDEVIEAEINDDESGDTEDAE